MTRRLVFPLRRRPELSREEFQAYWWDHHRPLVAERAEVLGIRRYQQVHTVRDARPDALPAFDGVAELWVDGIEPTGTPEERRAASADLLADERRFIDLSASPIWIADEVLVRQGAIGEERLTAVLRRRPGTTRAEFLNHWRNVHGPLALANNDVFGFRHYIQLHTPDDAEGNRLALDRNAPPPFDGVSEIWLDDVHPSEERRMQVQDMIMQDEARFVDYAASAVFFGVVRLVFDRSAR